MPYTSHQMAYNVRMIYIINHLVRMVTAELFIAKNHFFFFAISRKSVGHIVESCTSFMDMCAMRNTVKR